ncbi:divalent metal cation (Fe/Co/Zn/Cd) transporter [Paraburkholderia tropica]|uniref:cation transporter n=1 Tax=Paraburkholderia TaxID=1822464 RepID=UPI00161066ED|nr:cation transporter [Paraburkholderia tropica]MBB3003613.1 divalent metal cation (Fe/Co/Zn/Cd) transporter [Paraburkholderia tropica]MBB6322478.1 divalent metal cation (Fe/Co/Zn/Cd) transporter [Paraburkholderia tropica]
MRAVRFSVLASATLVALQLTIGWCADSRAIIADGTHTLVDLLVDAVLFASLFLRLRQWRGMPARALSWTPATLCTALSAFAGATLLAQGMGAFSGDPAAAAATSATTGGSSESWVLLAALPVIAIREYMARRLGATAESVSDTDAHAASVLSASAWHARIDALSACAAAVGAGGILAGFGGLDQIATGLIGVIMLATALFSANSPVRQGLGRLRNLASRALRARAAAGQSGSIEA